MSLFPWNTAITLIAPQRTLMGWAALAATVALRVATVQAEPAAVVPALDHVIVVVMENHDYSTVRTASYTANLVKAGAELTNSYATTHPSQPNYFALWAGSQLGVTDNTCPAPDSPLGAENLGHACEAAGKTWRAYCENLPSAGSAVCTADSTLYTRRHDPWTNFGNLNHLNQRPYSDLARDISNHTLPSLAFVIPNNCNNFHDCSVATGDAWLAANLPAMIHAVGPNGLVILTWDEDGGTYGNNNHILTVFAGQWVKAGYKSTGTVNHYNVLRTVCNALRLVPFGSAATAAPITDLWLAGPVGVARPGARGPLLSNVAPNPSPGSFAAQLWLPEAAMVEATLVDLAGRPVRHLEWGMRSGTLELRWDGRRDDGVRATPGVYFLRVRTGAQTLTRKAVLVAN